MTKRSRGPTPLIRRDSGAVTHGTVTAQKYHEPRPPTDGDAALGRLLAQHCTTSCFRNPALYQSRPYIAQADSIADDAVYWQAPTTTSLRLSTFPWPRRIVILIA
ncbi:MAG: hypothetical protein ACREYE_11775 [Gammaproteobacteria bacterium]